MTETSSVKVYELAKELGMDSISLLDRLKELKISVKSHMSSLSEEQAERARESLAPKTASSTTKKKAAVKKKKTTVVRRKVSDVAGDVGSASVKASSPIIRRRSKSEDGETTTVTTTITRKVEAVEPAPTPTVEKAEPAIPTPEVEPVVVAPEAPVEEIAPETTAPAEPTPSLKEPVETPTQEISAVASTEPQNTTTESATTPPVAAKKDETGSTTTTHHSNRGGTETTTTTVTQVTFEKSKEDPSIQVQKKVETKVVKKKTSVLSTSNITAKSLLKVIEQGERPQPRSENKDDASGDSSRPHRIIKVTNESIDRIAEEEQKKKRGPGSGEKSIRPEDVRFADYRKKEVVFLGKKKKVAPTRDTKQTEITKAAAHKRVVEMGDAITVNDLAMAMKVKATDLIRKLMKMGQMVSMHQLIDFDTASLIASEYEYEVKNISFKEESILDREEDAPENLQPRPPVVTVMGHVDHGKTSLLDAIKNSNVVSGEAGGITQHIGAYTVEQNGHPITFIDTPGHAAFTQMRARGANITDIVILVVAADDGVMPQTREAVSHAQAAGVPIVVAVNKIDKPQANPEKVMQGLSELGLLPEDWGGDTMFVPVSAKDRTNLDKLLEAVLLNAEILDLKANPTAPASGVVLEARLEKGRGPVASVLVKRGTLKKGDAIVAGQQSGRVRAMINHLGQTIETVSPGMAAEVLGLEAVPNAGDAFDATADEALAKKLAQFRIEKARQEAAVQKKVSLEDLLARMDQSGKKELRIILKADVFGSVEAVRESLEKLSTDKVKVTVVLAQPGGISESDVLLARASEAIIIGFNVRPETNARKTAENEGIEIKTYSIIYELIDDVRNAMVGMLDKRKVENYLGRAEVRQTFSVPKVGTIAGCSVIDGKILRNANVRLLRDSRVIFEGKLSSLKRFKDDAREVAQGYECGMGIEGFNDIKVGDLIEAYEVNMIVPDASELGQSL